MRPDSGTEIGKGVGVGLGVAVGAGVGVGVGAEVEEGTEVAVGSGEMGTVVGVWAVVEVGVGAGMGDGLGSGVARSSSMTLEMSSKDGEPSYFTPVTVGSLERTKMVGVTETSFCRARLMSLWMTPSYLRESRQDEN